MTARTDERLLTGHSGRMLGTLALAWAVLQTGRLLLSPLLPAILDSLAITTVGAGVALGALQVVYAAAQYPSGRLSDSLTRASLILPGLAVLVAAFSLLLVTPTYAVFVAATTLLGLGKGLFAIPSRALLSDLFVARRGQALGLYTAGTDLGGLLAAALAVVAVGSTTALAGTTAVGAVPGGWRAPYALVVAALGTTAVAYALWTREPLALGGASVAVVATVTRLLSAREQRESLVAFTLFYFVVGAWVNFLPTYLAEAKGLTAPTPQLLFSVVFVVGIGTKPAAGVVSDRLPRRLVSVVGLGVAAASLVAVTVLDSVAGIALAIGLFALGYKTQFPIVDAVVLDAAPTENLGGDLGAARALFLGVGAFGPVYMGAVAAGPGYGVGFAGLVVCLVVAAGLLALDLRR